MLLGVRAQLGGQRLRQLRLLRTMCGLASICEAWLSVMPVIANRNIPSRHMAELIQCHWCKCFSQTARLALRAELALGTLTGHPSTKNTNDNDYHLMGQPILCFCSVKYGRKKTAGGGLRLGRD
jgi:hypothetical protein